MLHKNFLQSNYQNSDNSKTSAHIVQHTPLHELHLEFGAKMVDFAGYEMPINYKDGIIKEHMNCCERSALFDVSHMGQAILETKANGAEFIESITPSCIESMAQNQLRYSVLLNESGGIIDDLMITKLDDKRYMLIVNASRKKIDFEHIKAKLGSFGSLEILADKALIALQGPLSAQILEKYIEKVSNLRFMYFGSFLYKTNKVSISRSGYSGKDGFEISLDAKTAVSLAKKLLGEENCHPAGLGARDTLRLEAGLCLYGNELNETTSPIEAGLTWVVAKRRRKKGGFPGSDRIIHEIENQPKRKLKGFMIDGRIPVRKNAEIYNQTESKCGYITSGGYSPTLKKPIAIGYIDTKYLDKNEFKILQAKRQINASISKLPFTPHQYAK